MKIIELAQDTLEWFQWRHAGIGSSDAAVIMGVDRYGKTAEDLWDQKRWVYESGVGNSATRWGKEQEPLIRHQYAEWQQCDVRPVCIIHDSVPWLRASLDGLIFPGKDRAIEIKCPNWELHGQACEGQVPHYYWVQIQHQFLVSTDLDTWTSDLKVIDYLSYNRSKKTDPNKRLVRLEVAPDRAFLQDLWTRERAFQDQLSGAVSCSSGT